MNLVINLLSFEREKSYGFQEYIFNLLDDFAVSRDIIKANSIILLIRKKELIFFKKRYCDVFQYYAYEKKGLLDYFIFESRIINNLYLSSNDVLLFPGNTMPIINSRAKKILVIHDLLFRRKDLFTQSIYYFIFRLHKYIFVPYSIKHADIVIGISRFTKKEIIEAYNIDPSKVLAIYNYFNFDKYNDEITDKSNISGKYILSIGAKYKHKNHKTILKAFELFNRKHKDFLLVLVGALSPQATKYYSCMNDDVRAKVIIRNRLTNSDIKRLYEKASLYVSASLYEGLGMPVVEALYFGLPTLLSDIDIHHEVSLDNAKFFSPMSYAELSALFENCLIESKNIDFDFSFRLEAMYSKENTSQKYIEEINKLFKRL